jgi:hypothetical protein
VTPFETIPIKMVTSYLELPQQKICMNLEIHLLIFFEEEKEG